MKLISVCILLVKLLLIRIILSKHNAVREEEYQENEVLIGKIRRIYTVDTNEDFKALSFHAHNASSIAQQINILTTSTIILNDLFREEKEELQKDDYSTSINKYDCVSSKVYESSKKKYIFYDTELWTTIYMQCLKAWSVKFSTLLNYRKSYNLIEVEESQDIKSNRTPIIKDSLKTMRLKYRHLWYSDVRSCVYSYQETITSKKPSLGNHKQETSGKKLWLFAIRKLKHGSDAVRPKISIINNAFQGAELWMKYYSAK